LLDGETGADTHLPSARHLAPGHGTDVLRRKPNGFSHARRHLFRCRLHLLPGDLDRSVQTIELTRVAQQGSLASGPDVGDDLRDALLSLAVAIALRPEQRLYCRCVTRINDRDHDPYTTILFNGYSTIP
jgi:hypothetical protein